MNREFIHFLNALKTSKTELLIESIINGYSVLFEEPHILIKGDKELHNNVPVDELSNVLKKTTSEKDKAYAIALKDLQMSKPTFKAPTKKPNIPEEMDAFDLYMEDIGVKREDGKIHEPIQYIKDIYNGKLVISPKTNTPIKITDSFDRELFIESLSENFFAGIAIIQYLLDDKFNNPLRTTDKTGLLPDKFYTAMQTNPLYKSYKFKLGDKKISMYDAIMYLKHTPVSMHEASA